jgi:hypothetical protein
LRTRFETIGIIIVVALAAIISAIAVNDLLGGPSKQNSATTNSFIQQPVVDIIIPTLFAQTATGGVNSPLNLTLGESYSLTVEVYTTVALNASLIFHALPLGSSSTSELSQGTSGPISGIFNPADLMMEANGKGISTFSIAVSDSASVGAYNAVVSAVNLDNSSQIWGDIFQINVTK